MDSDMVDLGARKIHKLISGENVALTIGLAGKVINRTACSSE